MFLTDEDAVPPLAAYYLSSTFELVCLLSLREAAAALSSQPFDAVVLDLEMGSDTGDSAMEFLRHLRDDKLVKFALTRSDEDELIATAISAGAHTVLTAPIDFSALRKSLERAIASRARHGMKIERNSSFCDLIGVSIEMARVYDTIRRVADSPTSVIIRGESGTGKELVARAIVACSPRKDKPLVSVNCAAIPESLMEAELFGHEKGAYTGAHTERPGHVEAANGGTLFLDEISSLDLSLQSKLLRVLEEHTVQRIGSKSSKRIDFRLITATNDDLEEMVHAGRFREDLYYRINVVPIYLPALRERREDIPLLIDHFLKMYSVPNGTPPKRVEPEVIEVLEDYQWPGNVRELENLVQRLVLLTDGGTITVRNLPQQILFGSTASQDSLLIPENGIDFHREMAKIEAAYVEAALRRTGGRKMAAAALLKINRQQMKYLCHKYKIA